jgi:hypothetical protein
VPATPRPIEITEEDLRKKVSAAIRQGTGDAVPVLEEGDDYPRVWDINDLVNRPPATWLIENLVEDKGLLVFFGPDKVGKTAALSNFLWAWCGHKDWFLTDSFAMADPPESDERRVLYVLLEGQANFYARYDAWCHAYNNGKEVQGFYVMDEGLSLFQPNMQWEKPSTWTPSATKLWNAVDALRPHVIVIDTLSRATAGMDENSSHMAQVVGMMDNLRDVYGLTTIIVHHTALSDGDRPRGHSSLKGAASSYARIEGEPEDPVLTLITGPHRNSDQFKRVPFARAQERDSFVIKAGAPPDNRSLGEKLLDMVPISKKDAVTALYPGIHPAQALKRLWSVVHTQEELYFENDMIVKT